MSEYWRVIPLRRFEEKEGPQGPQVPLALVNRAKTRLRNAFYSNSTGATDSSGKRKYGSFKPKKEADMHAPVCEAVNDVLSPMPYVAKDTADRVEDSFLDHKTDIAVYHLPRNPDGTFQEYPGRTAWELSDEEIAKSAVSEERKPNLARPAWAWVICAIELKVTASHDLFEDMKSPDPFPDSGIKPELRKHDDAKRTRVQLIRYAMEMFVRQPRVFVYTVLIVRNKARLLRWDRCGVVVSELFDYVEDPTPLLNFFYRLARASPRAQGFDTSVSLATEAQINELNDYRKQLEASTVPGAVYEKQFIDEMMSDPALYPMRQLKVPVFALDPKSGPQASPPPEPLTLIIGKRRVGIFSPTGRGTIGFFAYIVGKRQLVFLKDTWRGDSPDITEELETYRRLYQLRVKNIPDIVGGGDVMHEERAGYTDAEQCTRNHEYLATNDENIVRRKHYRLVTTTLGLPLSEYSNSHAMVHVIRDALEAHRGAWANGQGVLHRDISVSNILIDIRSSDIKKKPRGILTDWDLSRGVDTNDERQPTQHTRSGTWPFMSGPLLRYPIKPHWVADDLESFIHVMDFLTLQYHDHSLTKPPHARHGLIQDNALADHVLSFFYHEHNRELHGRIYVIGGKGKYSVYDSDLDPYRLKERSIFSQLMQALHALCRSHYHSAAVRELPTKYPEFAGALPAELEEEEPSPFLDLLPGPATTQTSVVPDPLADHEKIFSFIDRALASSKWPKSDKIQDQFAGISFVNPTQNRGLSSYERRDKIGSQSGSRASSSKPRKAKKAKVEANTATASTSATGNAGEASEEAEDGDD